MGEPLPKQVLDTAVDPAKIVDQTFNVGRRGFDQQQVQDYLRAVAASLHDAQQREDEMRTRMGKAVRRAEAAEQKARNAAKPDTAELHRQLGDQVTSVLDAAEVAAEDCVTEAKATAAEIVAAAQAQAAEAQLQAAAIAADAAAEAETEAQAVLGEARSDAKMLVGDAADRIETVRKECDALVREAEEARGQILEDMERRRRQARAQVERLRVGRDRLLRSYDVVRRTLDETTVDLKSSLKEAKVRGDSAARAITSEPLSNRQQLEAELADAKLIGRVKISEPVSDSDSGHSPAPPTLRSPALPRPLDPPQQTAPTPRKPRRADARTERRPTGPAQPKAPAVAPVLSATPPKEVEQSEPLDETQMQAELAQLEDDNLNVIEPSDDIEEVTAVPVADGADNELFALLRIQSSGKKGPRGKPGKTTKAASSKAKTSAPKAKTPAPKANKPAAPAPKATKAKAAKANTKAKAAKANTKAAAPKPTSKTADTASETPPVIETPAAATSAVPGLDAQRDAVIADAAKQLEKRLKRALADEQNDLLASIRATKKQKTVALTDVVGDVDNHVKRYVIAIHEVAAVTYGAGAALVDARPDTGQMPAGAVEELLQADVVLPIRERLASLDAIELDGTATHIDPVRTFYRQRKTDHLGIAASRLAQLLCVAGLHDATSTEV